MTTMQNGKGIRIPPSSDDAEMAVLGAMMRSREAAEAAMAILTADCFYRPAHRTIFEAMIALIERGEAVDSSTLRSELDSHGEQSAAGAVSLLPSLATKKIGAENVERFARIVHETWLKRRLLAATNDIQSDCWAPASDIGELIDRAERRMFEIAENSTRERGPFTMRELAAKANRALHDVRSGRTERNGAFGVQSGLARLDAITGGFQNSDLIVIAGRPSTGKSGLALSIARNVAVDAEIPVGFFTLEMSPQQLMLRLLAAESGVDAHQLRLGRLSDEDWGKTKLALKKLRGAPLFIEDSPGLGIMELRARARKMKRERGIGLIVVDYLQLMQAPRSEQRERELSIISKSLKQLAKELDIPVIALSQLNRPVETRAGKRPLLADLREFGTIEEDGDVVMFVHRPESSDGSAEIVVAKHRSGPTGVARLAFRKQYARFEDSNEGEKELPVFKAAANG